MRYLNCKSLDWFMIAGRGIAGAVFAVGAGVLVGWATGIEAIKRVIPGLVAMNPSTAIAFSLAGISLWIIQTCPQRRRLSQFCASLVLLIGVIKLASCLGAWDLGIDQWLFYHQLTAPESSIPNRMAPNTALNFVLIGIALLCRDRRTSGGQFMAQILAILSALFSILALIGYFNGVKSLYAFAAFIPMALHTALTFLLVCAGIALRHPIGSDGASNGETGATVRKGDSMKTSLQRKITLGFAAAIFMLIVIGVVAYNSIQQFVSNARWDDHTRQVLVEIVNLSSTMKDVETGTRGYILSGEQAYLEPYHSATASVDSIVRNLRELTADNPQQQKRLDRIEPLVREKLAISAQAVLARQKEGHDTARQSAFGGDGKSVMDQLRKVLAEMTEEEANLLHQRSAAEESSARRTITVISCGSALAFLLVAMAGWMIRRDIGARARAEAALRASEERFRGLVDSAREYAILTLDTEGRIATWNPGAQRIKGYKADEIIGQHFSRFYPPEDVQRGKPQEELRIVMEKGQYEEEGWRLRKDGSRFWANVLIMCLRDSHGQHIGFSKITRDLTERKRNEDAIAELNADLARGNAQLESVNKELEAFSYSVSHDLRAPLRSIDGFSQALLEDYSDKLDEGGKDALNRVRAATQRMAQLIDDILNLSRVTRSEMRHEPVNLSALAKSVIGELRKAQPNRAVQVAIRDGLMVQGDGRLLRVVLDNLIGNAWKFTGRKEDARIEFGLSDDGAFFVRDNGAGFDMAYAEKLFGAFQRLHAMNEFAGTGIGLATVQRIVRRHGGRVWAQAAVGQGATFYFTVSTDAVRLPRAAAA